MKNKYLWKGIESDIDRHFSDIFSNNSEDKSNFNLSLTQNQPGSCLQLGHYDY